MYDEEEEDNESYMSEDEEYDEEQDEEDEEQDDEYSVSMMLEDSEAEYTEDEGDSGIQEFHEFEDNIFKIK
jgi:hypothetical protein